MWYIRDQPKFGIQTISANKKLLTKIANDKWKIFIEYNTLISVLKISRKSLYQTLQRHTEFEVTKRGKNIDFVSIEIVFFYLSKFQNSISRLEDTLKRLEKKSWRVENRTQEKMIITY